MNFTQSNGNKKALTRKYEDGIIKEIKACGIKGTVHLTPTKINVSELSFDDKHIN